MNSNKTKDMLDSDNFSSRFRFIEMLGGLSSPARHNLLRIESREELLKLCHVAIEEQWFEVAVEIKKEMKRRELEIISSISHLGLSEKALAIATRAHEGQKRRDGTPYIGHPIAVAVIALELSASSSPIVPEVLKSLAYLHDVAEDVEEYRNNESKLSQELFRNSGCDSSSEAFFTELLINLNKNRHKNYLEFVFAAASNPYSRLVKLADLQHNLSDTKEGCLKNKYLLAQYILRHE